MDTSQPPPSAPSDAVAGSVQPSPSDADAKPPAAQDTQQDNQEIEAQQPTNDAGKIQAPPAQDATAPVSKPASDVAPAEVPGVSAFSPSTQEIIKSVSAGSNISTGTPEWEAAREQVLQTMGQSNQAATTPTQTLARGGAAARGRGTGLAAVQTALVPEAAAGETAVDTTPVKARGRGGRPRGRGKGSGRGRRKSGKRKREDDDGLSDDESNGSDYTPVATVTKSGRNVMKPSQYKPLTEQSPTSEPKKKRPYRKGPEYTTLCVKCQRGHSPLSNAIVFCDGCNAAYHQFCHDPHIPREVIEVPEKEWFCGSCQHIRENESLRLQDRVSGEDLTNDEKSAYLSTLSSGTLISLIIHATTIHPKLPLFAPNTRALLNSRPPPPPPPPGPPQTSAPMPTPPASQLHQQPSTSMHPPSNLSRPLPAPSVPTNANTNASYQPKPRQGSDAEAHGSAGSPEEEQYPDYPPTYPRPGHGPMKIQPTNDSEGTQWLNEEDHYGVFSHMYNDGNGNLVHVQPQHQHHQGQQHHPHHQQQAHSHTDSAAQMQTHHQQQQWQEYMAQQSAGAGGYTHPHHSIQGGGGGGGSPNGQHPMMHQAQSPHAQQYVSHAFHPGHNPYAQSMNGGGGGGGGGGGPMHHQQQQQQHQTMQQHHGAGGMHGQRAGWQ